MTPEQLDEARAKEALRRLVDSGQVYCHEDIAALGARLAREGWTPPEPVDPDLLAFREWAAAQGLDPGPDVLLRDTFLAGARMARERERERAKVLVEYVREAGNSGLSKSGEYARAVLCKYARAGDD